MKTLKRPSRRTAERLASCLARALRGRRVDRVWRPGPLVALVRFSGRDKRRLLVDLDPQLASVVLTDSWPQTPERPDQVTLRARGALEGRAVQDVTPWEDRGLVFSFDQGVALHVQLAGRYLNIAVVADSELVVAWQAGRPATDPDSPALPDGPCLLDEVSPEEWMSKLAALTGEQRERMALERRRVSLDRAARGLARKARRALDAADRDLGRVASSETDRRYGELLKTQLHRVERGASEVRVQDYTDPEGGMVTVPLDPSMDAVANMERFFKRYRRFRDAAHGIGERHRAAQERVDVMDGLRATLEASTSDDELDAVEQALRAQGWRPPQAEGGTSRAKPAERLPYQRFVARGGLEILVGRTAADNDTLTFRVARGRDIWLHARDVPGSHVVLRVGGGQEVSREALLDAAALAAWHSRARSEAVVDVQWTERKHVRRAPGSAPGRVLVSEGRNLSVRLEPEHIDRLYAGRRQE